MRDYVGDSMKQNVQETVTDFGQRLKHLIDFLIENEEPKLLDLAERLDVPPQTLSRWRKGTSLSINRYDRFAACTKVSKESIKNFLNGHLPFEAIVEERNKNLESGRTNSPLARIIREIDKLSDKEYYDLNCYVAAKLRDRQRSSSSQETSTATKSAEPAASLHEFISFNFSEQTRLQRYFEAVKKTYGSSDEFVAAAVEAGASEKSARALVGDVLLADSNRQYCSANFKHFLALLPRIRGWKGDNPILDESSRWNSFEELASEIRQPIPTSSRCLQQSC